MYALWSEAICPTCAIELSFQDLSFTGFMLVGQVLKKSHRDASSTRKSIVDRCLSKVEHDVFTEFQQIRAGIFEEVSVDGSQRTQLRQHYANMPAHFVFQELMLKMELLMLIDDSSKGKKRAAMVKNANNALKMVIDAIVLPIVSISIEI